MRKFDLTIVTATLNRHKHLVCLMEQIKSQEKGGLRIEHIVVADGPDDQVKAICDHYRSRYLCLPEKKGWLGALAKDMGIKAARGDYIVIWDDDNTYQRYALAAIYAGSVGLDMAVFQVHHRKGNWKTIPDKHESEWFRYGNVDTACACVRRAVAQTVPTWESVKGGGDDYRWINKAWNASQTKRFVPLVIAAHL